MPKIKNKEVRRQNKWDMRYVIWDMGGKKLHLILHISHPTSQKLLHHSGSFIPKSGTNPKPKYKMFKIKPADGLTGERAHRLTGECQVRDAPFKKRFTMMGAFALSVSCC